MTFTPIVFVFIAMLGNDRRLFGARVVDTALAVLLVLLVDLVAWTTSPSLRPQAQLARAEGALEDFLQCQPSTGRRPGTGSSGRLSVDCRCRGIPSNG